MTVLPAIGYASPDQSHFTSRHYWEVGGLLPERGRAAGWGGCSTRSAPRTTRSRAWRSTARCRRRSPAARCPSRRSTGPRTTSGPRASGASPSRSCSARSASSVAARPRAKDVGVRAAGTAAAQAMQLRTQLQPFSGEEITPPVAYPDGEDSWFGESLAALAAMLGAGLPIRCAAISSPGDFDTHDNQADGFDSDVAAGRRDDRRLPGRPRGARARRPRRSRWSGRSSDAAPRRTTRGPTTAPAAPPT